MTDFEAIQQDIRELITRVSLLEDAVQEIQKSKAEARAALLRIAGKRKILAKTTSKKRGNNVRSKKDLRRR